MNHNSIALKALRARIARRHGIHPDIVENAQRITLKHFHAEAQEPAVALAGHACDHYLRLAIPTTRFAATLTSSSLLIADREADGRLHWEAYVQREAAAATAIHRALPKTALLGNSEAVHRIGRTFGLTKEATNELTAEIVLTLAVGHPYRPADQRHLTLADTLTQITDDDLAALLVQGVLMALRRTD
ncbi:hypothetical protein [Streptomyces flavofungini]|uniref:hypothetical protein n=1 Tax=Streptomyces flavofungini TaxID=68200 RepID=UPI0025B04AEF|nr:hypothetical protein [Streptomyces flavofungini]WJV48937.1 hypothetical protein QUY26_27520 [Streptomyces flavofungini]